MRPVFLGRAFAIFASQPVGIRKDGNGVVSGFSSQLIQTRIGHGVLLIPAIRGQWSYFTLISIYVRWSFDWKLRSCKHYVPDNRRDCGELAH